MRVSEFYPDDKNLEEGYGKYYCSTDKRWKERKGPKQTRASESTFTDYELAIMEGGHSLEDNTKPVASALRQVVEAFDKPYKILRWEKGDFGDVDAIARLDDNTFLSIMFNKGVSKDSKEETWSVEFYRNNSQEVTGEGDAQRVFATVISAMQTFIKKYKPNRIIFTASKEVEQGQNAQSRARLYDSLVQRYARSWGFRAFRADTGNKVIYELNRIKPVTEGTENNLSTIIQSFVASPVGQKYKQYDCKTVTRAFVQWAEQNKIPTQVVSLAPPSADFIAKNPRYKGKSGQGDGHIMPIVNGNAIDFTVRQFGVSRPFNNPLVTPTSSLPAVYGKFGYFTDKPEWFLGGKSHWIGSLNSIPSEIFNQNFGDELLEQGVAEGDVLQFPKEFRSDAPKENLEEIDRRSFLKGMGAAAMAGSAGSVKAANFQSLTEQQKDIVMQVIWSWIFTIDKEGRANELPFTSELTRFINIYDGSKKWVMDYAKAINDAVKKRKTTQDPNEFYAQSRKLRVNAQDHIDNLRELNDLGEGIKQQTQQTSSNLEATEIINGFTVIYGPTFLSSDKIKLKQRFIFHLKNQIDQLPNFFSKKFSNVNIYIGSGDLPDDAFAFFVQPSTWVRKGYPKDVLGAGGNIVVGNWERNHLNITGQSILIHEFAHAYQYANPSINNPIAVAYKNAMENKLYSNTYTSKNPAEYFGELTAMYFGESGEAPFNKQGLKKYDPTGYNMIEIVWGLMKEGVDHTMAENFADGRVKGKSSPGRVKRSGASCDGSVSDLRSKAKNASGEKAKMYHWCANMKSGRAKTESEILEDLEEDWKAMLSGHSL